MRFHCLLIVLFVHVAMNDSALAETFVYVSLSADDKIEIYRLGDAKLTRIGTARMPGDPGGVTVHPSKRFLVAAMRDAGKLSSFAIDPRNGALKPISTIKVDVDPAFVEYDKTGGYLLTAYYVTGKVALHRIDDVGNIAAEGNWYATDKNAHGIVTDQSNQWVFVPHTGANAIFQFAFNASTGLLKPNVTAAKVQFKPNTGPRHFYLHPNNRFGFCDNEQGSSVTAFSLDSESGTLKPLQTLPTIPKDFPHANSCARMMISPDGKYLYASNRGHDSIAGFKIDAATGRLKQIGTFPTEKTPRGFHIDPTGKVLSRGRRGRQPFDVISNSSKRILGSY